MWLIPFPYQPDSRQRRQRQTQRLRAAVAGNLIAMDHAAVTGVAAMVMGRVGVQHFAPAAGLVDAEAVIVTRHRRKVAGDNHFVAGFIGSPKMNFLPAKVIDWNPAQVSVLIADQKTLTLPICTQKMEPGATITLGLRPEHIVPQGGALALTFNCEVVERLGNSTYLFGQSCGIDNFKMLLPGDNDFKPYQQIDVFFAPENCLIFNDNGIRISK